VPIEGRGRIVLGGSGVSDGAPLTVVDDTGSAESCILFVSYSGLGGGGGVATAEVVTPAGTDSCEGADTARYGCWGGSNGAALPDEALR